MVTDLLLLLRYARRNESHLLYHFLQEKQLDFFWGFCKLYIGFLLKKGYNDVVEGGKWKDEANSRKNSCWPPDH